MNATLIHSRLLIFIASLFFSGPAVTADDTPIPRAFLEDHCIGCHDSYSASGGLDLSGLAFEPTDAENFLQWVTMHDRIAGGKMPPPDEPSLSAAARRDAVIRLAESLSQADNQRQARQGRVRLRRLNRVEYENTLRDLLALPGLEIKEMLPPDAEAHGFDNVGSALRVSYVQMGRYLEAAQEALQQAAWLAPELQSYQFRLPFPEIRRFQITKDLVTIDDEAVLLRQPNTAQTPWRIDSVEIPFPGEHTIRIRGRAATYQQEEGEEMGAGKLLPPATSQIVSLYQGTRILGSFDLTEQASTHTIGGRLHPGETLYLYVPTMQDWNPKWKDAAYTGPAVALEWIEVEGPAQTDWPRPSYRVLFDDLPVELWSEEAGCLPPAELGELKHPKRFPKLEFPHKKNRYHVTSTDPEADARRLLERFMTRAFRRPLPAGEVDRYLALVLGEFEKRKPFHEALMTGCTAILSSPDFLYFQESPGTLDDYALANRLAYFLWRSQPDDELYRLAESGELTDDAVLRTQVDRLLDDAKANRFIEDFTGQWLDLREIRATQPDEELYPEFDDLLLESMVAETQAFFQAMVQRNLPTRAVVDADFAIVNNVLAELYDLDDVEGVALRKVAVPNDSPRGGLLTQASLLKVTANGTTTSPVTRGAWVLDRLLGQPAPPPPPNVPAIDPDTRGAKTIRELLAKHRADPSCAGCHANIDPPGFALESFDVIGGWRQRYRSLDEGDPVDKVVDNRPVRYKQGLPVDPSGRFADGRTFADIESFKKLLLEDERQLAGNLTERLVVYSTGAGISFADRVVVQQILDATCKHGYGVRDLIHHIVQSKLFQQK